MSRTTLALSAALLIGFASASAPADLTANPESVVHVFHSLGGKDVEAAAGGVILNAAGGLIGAGSAGGSQGYGGIFSIDASGKERLLHSFALTEGAYPAGHLIQDDDGNIRGVTTRGGKRSGGTVYRMSPDGSLKVLYSFVAQNGDTGNRNTGPWWPASGLVSIGEKYYGVSKYGGRGAEIDGFGEGTIYSIDDAGTLSILHQFPADGSEGTQPMAALILASDGYLYGSTTKKGANGLGTVFKVLPDGTQFQTVYTFKSADGAGNPQAPLLEVGGAFYGVSTTVAFKLTSNGEFTRLHQFMPPNDGGTPLSGFVLSSDGALYGTTQYGGYSSKNKTAYGTVYRLTLDGAESVVHTFYTEPFRKGFSPASVRLTEAANGFLYGTCTDGGAKGLNGIYGGGVVFRIAVD